MIYLKMKTIKNNFKVITILAITIFSFTFTSCDHNDDAVIIVVSEEQAIEIVATSLAYNTYGMASNVNYVSNEISEALACGEQNTNSGTNNYVSAFGGITSIYQFNESYSKICTPNEIINYSISAFQDIDAVYFTSQQDIEASFTVTGLEDTAPNELYSGVYQREGNWYSKVYNDSLDVFYNMNFTDLNINKTTYHIVSGISAFNLNTNYSETSESNTFSGNVIFLNENEVQIDFTNGNSYLLNLETGEIILI